MIVEKVSVDRVKNKLALLAQKKKGVRAAALSLPSKRPNLEDDEEDDY